MRIIVTGSRSWQRPLVIAAVLAEAEALGELVIVHGGASGAETIADLWARRRRIPTECRRGADMSDSLADGAGLCIVFIDENDRIAHAAAYADMAEQSGIPTLRYYLGDTYSFDTLRMDYA